MSLFNEIHYKFNKNFKKGKQIYNLEKKFKIKFLYCIYNRKIILEGKIIFKKTFQIFRRKSILKFIFLSII